MTLSYRTATVGGLKVFYRSAGDPKHPAVLLPHGFPTSSHMFRDLIPALADRYYVVAPDLPGFGYTDAPDRRFHDLSSLMLRRYAPVPTAQLVWLGRH